MKTDISEFPEFVNVVKNNNLVYLFGTGISSALTGKPYGWEKWLLDGFLHMTDKTLAESYKAQLEADKSTNVMIKVAGKVISAAKAEGVYEAWMRDSFEKNALTNDNLAATLKKLLLLQDVFVTTNYDLLLEQATGLGTLSYENPDIAFEMLEKHRSTHVLHIHGVYASKYKLDNIIADEKQYQKVLDDAGAQFIQNILGTRTLVFVGCGKTTEDANIAQFIQFAKEKLKLDRAYYFLYNAARPVDEMPDNIRLIPYGDEYEDLPDFLEDMAQIRLAACVDRYQLVGRNVYRQERKNPHGIAGYHFAQEQIPFMGRVQELRTLDEFLDWKAAFGWYVVTGQAGSGKSRLAFEILHRIQKEWFGFFLCDTASEKDANEFVPFRDTLCIVDYVKGKEAALSGIIYALMKSFRTAGYKLRILFLEREYETLTGSWYQNLLDAFSSGVVGEFLEGEFIPSGVTGLKHPFIVLGDMEKADVEKFIGAVCSYAGLPADSMRDETLREEYRRKFEKLQYRPLFVQMFVEAWIGNNCVTPRYDGFEELLQNILKREQNEWLKAADQNQKVCNAWIRLLVRAGCVRKIKISQLTEEYQNDWKIITDFISDHSFPGMQRTERMRVLIAEMCQSVEKDDTCIEPLYPDIIKEYMLKEYCTDEERRKLANELWKENGEEFAVFLRRCITDFPYEDAYFRMLDECDGRCTDLHVLAARLAVLQHSVISPDDNIEVIWKQIDREYEFWHSLQIDLSDSNREAMSVVKFLGLVYCAEQYGGWAVTDVSKMMFVLEEALKVDGGSALEALKVMAVDERIHALASGGFSREALELKEKLMPYIKSSELEEYPAYLVLIQKNVELMTYLLDGEFYEGYEVLKWMEKNCDIDDMEQVRLFALSCFNLAQLSGYTRNEKYIERAMQLLKPYYDRYSDIASIASRFLMIRVIELQTEYFMQAGGKRKTDSFEYISRLKQIDAEIDKLEMDKDVSDAWACSRVFAVNLIGEDEERLKQQIVQAEEILDKVAGASFVPQVYIVSVRVLYEKVYGRKITREQVEKAYAYVLRFPDSETIRECFFAMLAESEEAGNKRKYMTPQIISGAMNDALMNPLNLSGLDEIDERMLQEALLGDVDFFEQAETYTRDQPKVYPNDPCPCGSGRKYKRCCGKGK